MTDKEKPIADEAAVLKGENDVIIHSGDGRIGKCDVLVNGVRQTFTTGKKITVSDAQLDVLRNSGRTVEELAAKKGKEKVSSDGEAGAGGRSSTAPAASKKSSGKSAGQKASKAPASNVNPAGGTTTMTQPGQNA